MRRNSAEDTRRLLLGIGLKLLHERGPSATVSHIRLSSVLRRAGLTTGAAYRIWGDQEGYHRELALAALRYRELGSTQRTVAAVVPAMAEGVPWQEVIRRGAEPNLRSYPEDIAFLTSLAIRASSYGDPDLLEAGHARHREALAAYGELYAAVLGWSGRRMRAGFRLADLAAALAAASEGFGLQNAAGVPHEHLRLDGLGRAAGDVDWSLLGVTTVALCEHMTEPDPAAPPFELAGLPQRWLAAMQPAATPPGDPASDEVEQFPGVGQG